MAKILGVSVERLREFLKWHEDGRPNRLCIHNLSLQLPRRPEGDGYRLPRRLGLEDRTFLRPFNTVDFLETFIRWRHLLDVVKMARTTIFAIAFLLGHISLSFPHCLRLYVLLEHLVVDIRKFDGDLPEQPAIPVCLSSKYIMYLPGFHSTDTNQKLTDSFRHCSPFPLLSTLSLLPDIAGLHLC